MPILRAVLMTRQAISPRLAIRIFLNISLCASRVGTLAGFHDFLLRGSAFEFVALVPGRPGARVGDVRADIVERVDVLHRAAQVPVRIEFVRGLMIAVGAVVVAQRHAGRLAAFAQVDAAAGVEHRHADLGEADVVRAVEGALLGLGVGRG